MIDEQMHKRRVCMSSTNERALAAFDEHVAPRLRALQTMARGVGGPTSAEYARSLAGRHVNIDSLICQVTEEMVPHFGREYVSNAILADELATSLAWGVVFYVTPAPMTHNDRIRQDIARLRRRDRKRVIPGRTEW
ncbi:MAG: hypothetical protein HC841_00365 [Verrucomicrobiae bacterium]|nr:hypothetical protein [Verrucomicrobiae bacterium]